MDAAPAAMPPKPNIAATIATTKKPNDHLIIKKFLYRFKLLFLIIQYKIYATYHNNSFNAWKRNFRVHLTTVRETPVTVWHTEAAVRRIQKAQVIPPSLEIDQTQMPRCEERVVRAGVIVDIGAKGRRVLDCGH